MKTKIASLLVFLLAQSAVFAAKIEVRHLAAVDSSVKTGDGFFFALPRTVVAADVSVDLKKFKPGNLAKYSVIFFPEAYKNTGDPQKAARTFNLKDVSFTSRGEPDPDWVFWMKLKSRIFVDRSVTMQMTEAGTVTGASSTVDNTLPDFLMGVLSTSTGIASKAILAGVTACPVKESKEKFIFCHLMGANAQLFAEYEDVVKNNPKAKAANDAVLLEIEPDVQGGFRIKPDSQLAEAKALFDAYVALDKGKIPAVQTPSPGVGVGDRVTQMDTVKEGIRKQFVGTAETLNWAGRFEVRPDATPKVQPDAAPEFGLMMLDPVGGACLNGTLYQGKAALTKDFFAPGTEYLCAKEAKYTLKVIAKTSSTDLPSKLRRKVKEYDTKKDGQGLPYRVPSEIKFSVQSDDKPTPFFSTLLVAQSGLVLALPPKMGGRQTKAGLTYFEATGAIKTLDSSGKTILNKSVADGVGASATGLLDANIAADKAAAAKADPLALLQRQRQLLEEESKIRAFCASLNRPDCVLASQP